MRRLNVQGCRARVTGASAGIGRAVSTVAYGGLSRSEAYGASKAAIKHLLGSLHTNLFPVGISVSVVCSGCVHTGLTDRNDFPMPFRIEAGEANRRIVQGIERRQPEIHFPKRFSLPVTLLTELSSRLYIRLFSTMVTQP